MLNGKRGFYPESYAEVFEPTSSDIEREDVISNPEDIESVKDNIVLIPEEVKSVRDKIILNPEEVKSVEDNFVLNPEEVMYETMEYFGEETGLAMDENMTENPEMYYDYIGTPTREDSITEGRELNYLYEEPSTQHTGEINGEFVETEPITQYAAESDFYYFDEDDYNTNAQQVAVADGTIPAENKTDLQRDGQDIEITTSKEGTRKKQHKTSNSRTRKHKKKKEEPEC